MDNYNLAFDDLTGTAPNGDTIALRRVKGDEQRVYRGASIYAGLPLVASFKRDYAGALSVYNNLID